MPYSGPNDESLPANVKELDDGKRAQWVEVWNSAFASCTADGGETEECETTAFTQANGVISEEREAGLVDLLQKIQGVIKGAALTAFREYFSTPTPKRAISWGRIADQVFKRFYEDTEHPNAWPIDFFIENGNSYVLVNDSGLLWRVDYSVDDDFVTLGEWTQVTETHPPATTRTTVMRQEDGTYRWLSISATSVLNRSGEIDSRDLFDSFVAHAEETGEYPIRQFYHLGDAFRTGQADWLARDGNCYLTSGVFDDTDFARREIASLESEPDYWGESIGFRATSEPEMAQITQDIKIPVYRQGINIEISTLPEREAASLFTRTELAEVNMLTDKARNALLKRFGDDEAAMEKWLEENPEAQNRAIDEDKLITREADEALTDEDPPVTVLDDSLVDEVVTRLGETEVVKGIITRQAEDTEKLQSVATRQAELVEAVNQLTQAVEVLQATDAEKRQAIMDDLPAPIRTLSYQPRQSIAPDKQQNGKTAAELAEERVTANGLKV